MPKLQNTKKNFLTLTLLGEFLKQKLLKDQYCCVPEYRKMDVQIFSNKDLLVGLSGYKIINKSKGSASKKDLKYIRRFPSVKFGALFLVEIMVRGPWVCF